MNTVEVDFELPRRPSSDLERLREYLSDRFPAKRREIALLLSREPASKGELVTISRKALAFSHELAVWQGRAERLFESKFADEFELTHESTASEFESASVGGKKTIRPSTEMVKRQAHAKSGTLKEAATLLEREREEMRNIAFWAQTLIRSLTSDELVGEAGGVPDAPSDFYESALASPLEE